MLDIVYTIALFGVPITMLLSVVIPNEWLEWLF